MNPLPLAIITQAGYFIAVFAAIAAAFIMGTVTKKFGGGVLASGFKIMSGGIFLIALGIITDALVYYFKVTEDPLLTALVIIKEILFVLGTYTVVIGSKRTVDQLKTLAS